MAVILKTLAFPLLVVIPWALMKWSKSETLVQDAIRNDPLLFVLLLLPSIFIMAGSVARFLKARTSPK